MGCPSKKFWQEKNCRNRLSHSPVFSGIVLWPLFPAIFVPFYLIACCFVGRMRLMLKRDQVTKGFVSMFLHNTAELEWRELSGREMLSSLPTLWLWTSCVLMKPLDPKFSLFFSCIRSVKKNGFKTFGLFRCPHTIGALDSLVIPTPSLRHSCPPFLVKERKHPFIRCPSDGSILTKVSPSPLQRIQKLVLPCFAAISRSSWLGEFRQSLQAKKKLQAFVLQKVSHPNNIVPQVFLE